MNVTVKTNSGLVIYPSYDPQHSNSILEFYKNQFHSYQIDAYKIVNNAGVVVAEEGQF
jgi:hypothetical protein